MTTDQMTRFLRSGWASNGVVPDIDAERLRLELAVKDAGEHLKAFPRGPMGLTPDAVKFSPQYRAAKQVYQAAFARLRQFNSVYRP